MSNGPIYLSPVAASTPFDNSTNGFVAVDVQAAIEEATKRLNTQQLIATDLVSTTSATFSTISGMTTTPAAGTYICIFTAFFYTAGVNVQGEVIASIGTTDIAETRRLQYDQAAILGLVTLSTNQGGSSASMAFRHTFNGSETLNIRFREVTGGTLYTRERVLLLLQVTP